ncbi:peptidoglycan L,D-transpeptidase, YkuD family, LysM domain-containing [Citrifermentans bemidjiense Bem]|uniref:Peptidoglycan L,D-transpeptidase, YkuD family, LysM domain-containing n=1 Tax=Citrifermentans bemidjiense (strain ATCC BAA-1014 / DSM 16622 / JCM 12645 / Bem) TaxID=404380 RepID=B5EGC7_CITBB|nr:L,D-transpeptidase family protein [Citrifermentans bemidjiense]ACH37992.1 peptidoglycan L,D-transpeptidase, YkuD family, LysM domain-containing [Citrifermentans bemidjiense Bem]
MATSPSRHGFTPSLGFASIPLSIILFLIAAALPSLASAATFQKAEGIIGAIQQYIIGKDESLVEVARRFDVGYYSIINANLGIDPFVPKPGTIVTIPTEWIVPRVQSDPDIVVNLAEYRLYLFPQGKFGAVFTFPLGIGDEGAETPLGTYTVIQKITSPSWHVPDSIRHEVPGLPSIVPPGPSNPLGTHALRLSRANILIHGTNRPWGIGRRSSHGCLRLYPEDIATLFELAHIGMSVVVVYQPFKICVRDGKVLIEVHRCRENEPTVGQALKRLYDEGLLAKTDFSKLVRAMLEKKGVPVEVSLAQ